MRVLHITSGLGLGGAETLLYALCSVWARDKNNEHIVISLTDNNFFDFDKLGVACYICPMKQGHNLLWQMLNLPWQILALRRKIKTIQPDIIKAWMYHACFFAHLTASAKLPQIWGIHHTLYKSYEKFRLHLLVRILSWLQTDSKPRKIIFVSNVSMEQHLAHGFVAEKATLIYNGIDTEKFSPLQKMRADKRKELGIEEDNFLIGNFGRFHTMKNHPLLAQVFAEVLKKHGQARLVIAGQSIDNQNKELMTLFSDPIFQGKILFLGAQRDMVALFNALDCYALTSHSGEAFPMVLLEAAACGVPAVANNVADIGKLILDKQFLIEHGKKQDFVDGIEKIMAWQDEELQQYADKSRQNVRDNYSIETVAKKYMTIFKQALE